MTRKEIKKQIIDPKTNQIKEETYIEITPDTGKCFQNKNTKHKFIHTIKHTGLPLIVRNEEINLYEEVSI